MVLGEGDIKQWYVGYWRIIADIKKLWKICIKDFVLLMNDIKNWYEGY